MNVVDVNIKEKQIGDNIYYVRAFPPLVALGLLGDLQAVVTTSLKDNDIKADEKEQNKKIDIGKFIAGIGQNLKGETLVTFANRLLTPEYVSVKLKDEEEPQRLDKNIQGIIFTGNIKEMLDVMYFVIEVNFGDFFASMGLGGFVMKALNR